MSFEEAPKITFRCLPNILERIDKLVESDKVKYINRSVVIRRALRSYLVNEELNNRIES